MNKKFLVGGLMALVILLGGMSISWAANSNYSAFRSFMGERAPRVTADNFNQFTKMQQKMANGDYNEAQKIRSELNLGQGCKNNSVRGEGCGACGMKSGEKETSQKGCAMGNKKGSGFVDKNNNGLCDFRENLK